MIKELEIFKALSDENRYKMFSIILFTELCICQIEQHLGLKQANVSKHMMKLRKLNMVNARKDAQWVHYSVKDEFIEQHQELIDYLKNKALQNDEITKLLNQLEIKKVCKKC